jgi:glutaredoxin
VKSFLDIQGVEYVYVDIDTEQGLELAKDWCVRSVPSMLVGGVVVTGDVGIKEMFSE